MPYQVCGDDKEADTSDFMLVCASCNRAKSWSCERCPNWKQEQERSVCLSCYWASPNEYIHVALRQIRRLDLTWTETEIADYEQLSKLLASNKQSMANFIKFTLRDSMEKLE